MSLKIVIPGADFSAIGNPKVKSLLYGFPLEGLAALYLMEDGVVDSVPTQLLDSSGKGNHAPIRSVGGSVRKTATGLTTHPTDKTRGWAARMPILHNSSFTRITVTQSRDTPETNGFKVPYGHVDNETAVDMNVSQQASTGTLFPELHLLITGVNLGTSPTMRNQLYAVKGSAGNTKWDALTAITATPHPIVAPFPSYVVHGFSFNKSTGRIVWIEGGATYDVVTGQDGIDWINGFATKNHGIGYVGYKSAAVNMLGDHALHAHYQGLAMEPADLLSAMSAARARVALRGIAAI